MAQVLKFPSPGDDPGRVWEIKDALRFKPTHKPKPIHGKGGNKKDASPPTEKPKVPSPNENTEDHIPCEPSATEEPPVDELNKAVPHDDDASLIASLNFWADECAEDSPTFRAVCRSSYGLNVYFVDLEYEPSAGRSAAAIAEEREYFDECLSWEQTSSWGQSFWGREYTPQTRTHSSDGDSHSTISTTTKSTDATCHTKSWSWEGK